MTVSNTLNKIAYDGDNTTTVFTYTFRVDNNADMQVYLGEDLQVGGYTVNRAGDNEGGDVTFDAPPALDTIVTLLRVVPVTQGADYQPYDAFPAETHEDALDKLTMLVQQLDEELSRVPKAPIGAPPDPEPGYSHNLTANRDASDCHPTSAVTGLDAALTGLQSDIDTNAADIAAFVGSVTASVTTYAGASLPSGYLWCRGGDVSRTTYADLFTAIGTLYGAGDGSTTFGLPDLRGQFVRGFDSGAGVDVGRDIGSNQSDDNKAHIHSGVTDTKAAHIHSGGAGGTVSVQSDSGVGSIEVPSAVANTGSGGAHSHALTLYNQGIESRPVNVAMNYIIKV